MTDWTERQQAFADALNVEPQVGEHTLTVSMSLETGDMVSVTRVVTSPRSQERARAEASRLMDGVVAALGWDRSGSKVPVVISAPQDLLDRLIHEATITGGGSGTLLVPDTLSKSEDSA